MAPTTDLTRASENGAPTTDDGEARLARFLAASNDGWWEADLLTQQVFYSDRFREILGYEDVELTDPWEVWNTVVHPDDLPDVDDAVAAAVATRAPTFTVHARCLHRTGREIPTRMRGMIDYDGDQPIRFSGTTTDLTEARRGELAKEQLVSVLSHELRTPLTAIGGAIETLLAHPELRSGDRDQPLLRVAERNTHRLRALIDDLLDLEALQAGVLPLATHEELVSDLIEQAVAHQRSAADARGVQVELRLDAPDRRVAVDRRRLVQVVANLLSNAIKHAPQESTVTVTSEDTGDGWVRIVVIDRGEGVPAHFTERIFTPFAQADASDRRTGTGTGLGLALSKALIEQHGGHISFRTGDGTTRFVLDLPCAHDRR